MMIRFACLCLCLLSVALLTLTAEEQAVSAPPRMTMETNYGTITLELYPAAAPETVANFIALAEGEKMYTRPGETLPQQGHYYDGLTFHRVIAGFMIQGGCPLGTGGAGPGFSFKDEINATGLKLNEIIALQPDLSLHPMCAYQRDAFFYEAIWPRVVAQGVTMESPDDAKSKAITKALGDLKSYTLQDFYQDLGYQYDASLEAKWPQRGALCMANSGPNTNGSQFFINLVDTPHLAGKHTVFGQVIAGMEVVDAIGKVPVNDSSKPVKPVIITSLRLVAEPAQAATSE